MAGYKYGGTYDAFISVTTETSEQLKEVKMYLEASYNSPGRAASVDVGRETKDFLKKKNASITVEIRTAGINIDSKAPGLSTIDDGIDAITSQLAAFQAKLKESADYMPCYVMLKRYSVLSSVLKQMTKEKNDGLIENRRKTPSFRYGEYVKIMESYYNVIRDLDAQKIDLEVKDAITREYNAIANKVLAYGNDFYMESNAALMEAEHQKILNLSARVKALGDRYSFYRVLMSFQAKEKAYNTSIVTDKPYGKNGTFYPS